MRGRSVPNRVRPGHGPQPVLGRAGNTYFWIDPETAVAGVILMQLLPFADPKALALLEKFEKALYIGLA